MDPFNIVIRRDGKQLGLNIHPKQDAGFMVLFEGSLVGEVFLDQQGEIWDAISARELADGKNQDYPCDESIDCEGLLFDKVMIAMIGDEISKTIGLN